MISIAVPELKDEAIILWREANELNLIFSSIVNKSRKKKQIGNLVIGHFIRN